MPSPYAIHWFRRDLRIAGNPALHKSWKAAEGRVVGIFCFEEEPVPNPDRFAFLLETLNALRGELRRMGSDLIALDGPALSALPVLVERLRPQGPPRLITWNRDYEPAAVERDRRMAAWLGSAGVPFATDADHCLIEPFEIGKEDGSPYRVYSAYGKRWITLLRSDPIQERLDLQRGGLAYLARLEKGRAKPMFHLTARELLGESPPDLIAEYRRRNAPRVRVPLPPAGSLAALEALERFRSRLPAYAARRDFPADSATSGLSIYFRNGSLTPAQVIAALDLRNGKFLAELVWREFSYHVLGRVPPRREEPPWENREDWFAAWKQGRTGYPIVDAAMRQLDTTGWMHNRSRMIVASFLTKDLLIDWRWGERYFRERLLDGDLAPNLAGWQWAASIGVDAQPYFRVFNPLLQSRKYDPDGEYIRRYVPELAHLRGAEIHAPPAARRGKYPPPLVDHAERRAKALEWYGNYSLRRNHETSGGHPERQRLPGR